MKIAVFHNVISGGAKRAIFEMVCRLAEQHDIDVFTLSTANHDFCDLRPFTRNYQIFDFKPRSLFSTPFGRLNNGIRALDIYRLRLVQQAVAGKINQGDYDVAFVHTDQFTNSPPVLQFLKIPSVYYCHDPLRKVYDPLIERPYSQSTGLRYWLDRITILDSLYLSTLAKEDKASLRAATTVLVNSYFSRETIYRLYGVSSRVCYLGIDTSKFISNGLERGGYVMSVGSVNPIKGFDFIIESLALIPETTRPPLIIVGNFAIPAEKEYLENLARYKKVCVEFRVLVGDAELVELYNRACITVYTPVLEPFGLVPLESMACGTPVVGVAEGGVRETVRHGETGLLADRNPKQFAELLMHCLTQPGLLESLGTRGPEYVRKSWSWTDCAVRLESFLSEAIEGQKV